MGESQKLALYLTPESIAALIAERCYKDADFRCKFAADPRAMLEQESGKKLPPGVQLIPCQNDDKHWHIPVPAVRENQSLNDAQMEQVSAGEVASIVIAGTVISGILVVGAAATGLLIAQKVGGFNFSDYE